MRPRHRLIAAIIVSFGAFAAANFLAGTNLPSIVRVLVVFIVVKLLGDLVDLVVTGFREIIFYEDFLRDLFSYLLIGLVAWGAITLGGRLTGTEVSAAVPAIGVYLLFLLVPPKRRGMGNEPY